MTSGTQIAKTATAKLAFKCSQKFLPQTCSRELQQFRKSSQNLRNFMGFYL